MFEATLFTKDFKILDKKYYLVDAEYFNMDYFLCSYHGIDYYLKEWATMGKKPVNNEKLFNFCLSSICNMIERIFEVIN